MGETAGKMKQFATWFTHGVPGGAKLRGAIYQARTGPGCWNRWSAFSRRKAAGGDGRLAEMEADEEMPGFPEGALVCD